MGPPPHPRQQNCNSVVEDVVEDPCDSAIYKEGCQCFASTCDAASCLGDGNCAQAFACAAGTCGTPTHGDIECVKACGAAHPGDATDTAISCYETNCNEAVEAEVEAE